MSGAALMGFIGSALTVSVSPPLASGGGATGGSVPSVTAEAAGGAGPITYAWTIIQSDVYPLTVDAPASATTGFTFADVPNGGFASGTARVTATRGVQTAFRDINVQFSNTSGPSA